MAREIGTVSLSPTRRDRPGKFRGPVYAMRKLFGILQVGRPRVLMFRLAPCGCGVALCDAPPTYKLIQRTTLGQ